MAITINGSGTITGISAGGLPDGSVVAADLASSLDLTGKTVTLPSGTGGKILQVVGTVKTDTFSYASSSSSTTKITGLTTAITPASSSNKILVMVVVNFGTAASTRARIYLGKGASDAPLGALGDAAGSRMRATSGGYVTASGNMSSIMSFNYLDTAGQTSEITYSVYFGMEGSNTGYVNRSYNDPNDATVVRAVSTIYAIEVAA